ncbi:serine/threonine protein phosphatase [Brevibacillus laterosporus]|uniref:Metallophosphoesterase family protein n=1 Tax=Brevibacillus halotolerans TaxID=1507437 RepID=A0ABT4HX91_9BACL|nr:MULTISPECIES: metallophosphoesterase family protein [Brevibacillus]MCR8985682.1 serine/threonine protein phosphatase [Brevibacillus laterosporus]MCZ0831416.1 metallophosphoesterase family protein [Brevibacillus halotolerans]
MKRTLVMSDIHGELDKMEQLLAKANYHADKDQLILLGDYVDRGPNSKGVIAKVKELTQAGAIALKGNHEDMMIKALTIANEFWMGRWMRNNAPTTMRLYGFELPLTEEEALQQVIRPEIGSNKPPKILPKKDAPGIKLELPDQLLEDIRFLEQLPLYYETEEYIFIHAGVHPDKSLDEMDEQEMIWIREEFHNGYAGEKTVIFGHTSTNYLHADGSTDVYFGKNKIIGIDGGCVYGGKLHCLELPSRKVYTI